MKKALIIIVLIIIVAGAGFYFFRQKDKDGPYVGDDFTIVSPAGWTQTHLQGTLVSFQNLQESYPDDSAAAKINFRSYLAVSFDNAAGQTITEAADLVKEQTRTVVPDITFVSETDGLIDGQPAKFMEAELTQQNIDFKVLIAVVLKDDKYFTFSGNTTVERWSENRDLFYNSIDSFKFK